MGFPIRKSADQRLLSSPRGLSQSATSFIASQRQGIRQTPFLRLFFRKTVTYRGKRRRCRQIPEEPGNRQPRTPEETGSPFDAIATNPSIRLYPGTYPGKSGPKGLAAASFTT